MFIVKNKQVKATYLTMLKNYKTENELINSLFTINTVCSSIQYFVQ